MKIDTLEIRNFRGISRVAADQLGEMVIIAGANGSGKSCVFDAIRLIKSLYGGYQQNEFHQWAGEFNISLNTSDPWSSIFRDPSKPILLKAGFSLHADEWRFLTENAGNLVWAEASLLLGPELAGQEPLLAALTAQLSGQGDFIDARVAEVSARLKAELDKRIISAEIRFEPGSNPSIAKNQILTTLFSNYIPGKLGLIDYNGPQRHFQREGFGGINLNASENAANSRSRALYNYQSKYSNIKTELAAAYIRELIRKQARLEESGGTSLDETFSEMFNTFFPDKRYLGAQPTASGTLEFPIETEAGIKHDINDLSSGEKEIAYGYLRLRDSAPRYSIILLDEPELHLNPGLARALPAFYREHLGAALDNQIWLVTHSDAILSQVVGLPNYHVFHMGSARGVGVLGNQLQKINGVDELEATIISLVGEIATYTPFGKLVIFEGGGPTDIDVFIVKSLCPELIVGMNCISATSKSKVRNLAEVLNVAVSEKKIPFDVYSVTDMDSERTLSSGKHLVWDVYHIENYLLEPDFILSVAQESPNCSLVSIRDVEEKLVSAARQTVPSLVRHAMLQKLEQLARTALPTGVPIQTGDFAAEIDKAVTNMAARIAGLQASALSFAALQASEAQITAEFQAALTNGSWRVTFQGRSVLKAFVSKNIPGMSYEAFRNSIIARMREAGFIPLGMARVLRQIATG